MQRLFDIVISFTGLIIVSPVLLVIFLCLLISSGSPLFIQSRVGRNQLAFNLIKFRTMKLHTRNLATHLVDKDKVTRFGFILRHTKLDELPQLWNVLVGDMSMVGPRPCLFNQEELIAERARYSIFTVRPGITGLAQLKNVDMSNPHKLVEIETVMLKNMNILLYFKYIFLTLLGQGAGDHIHDR